MLYAPTPIGRMGINKKTEEACANFQKAAD